MHRRSARRRCVKRESAIPEAGGGGHGRGRGSRAFLVSANNDRTDDRPRSQGRPLLLSEVDMVSDRRAASLAIVAGY